MENITSGYDKYNTTFKDKEYYISAVTWMVMMPLLLVAGAISNIIALFVFSRNRFHGSVTAFLLKVLALFDLTILSVNFCFNQLIVAGYDIRVYSVWVCKLYALIVIWSCCSSSWVLVLVSFEPALAVNVPLRAKQIFSKKCANIGVILINFISLIPALLYMVIHNIVVSDFGEKYCDRTGPLSSLIAPLVYHSIPFILMLILNTFIIVGLYKARLNRAKITSDSKHSQKMSMTIMLVCVNIWFLVNTFPISITFLMYPSGYINTKAFVQYTISFVCLYLNHAFILCSLLFIWNCVQSRNKEYVQGMLHEVFIFI